MKLKQYCYFHAEFLEVRYQGLMDPTGDEEGTHETTCTIQDSVYTEQNSNQTLIIRMAIPYQMVKFNTAAIVILGSTAKFISDYTVYQEYIHYRTSSKNSA